MSQQRWTASIRAIQHQIERARLRTTLTAGLEYNPLAAQVSPLLNWLAVEETAKRPAMILGTSSDRIGTKSGQSFYATLQWQSLFIFDGVHFHPTVSYSRGRHVVSLILVRGNDSGLSYSISF